MSRAATEPVTVVTALYDIGREQQPRSHNKHRPFSAYREWLKWLLRLNVPLVIFTTKEEGEWLEKWRSADAPLTVIARELSKLPYYHYHEQMQKVAQERAAFYANRPKLEHVYPLYDVVIHSKLPLMLEVAESNPYHSECFFWIDAGYFRPEEFPTGIRFALEAPWPKASRLEALGERFFIEQRKPVDQTTDELSDDYLHRLLARDQRVIQARVMGGRKAVIAHLTRRMKDLFLRTLRMGYLETEEVLLSLILRVEPDTFFLYPTETGDTARDLSLSGRFHRSYPSCPSLQVFTLATKNISDSALTPFLNSCRYFGYSVQVLARNEGWCGWDGRTARYLAACKSSEAEVIVLSDCTDLFFLGSATEMYSKFKQQKALVLISAETTFAYGSSRYQERKYDVEEMKKYFRHQAPRGIEAVFPNAGFIIGYRDKLIEVLEAILSVKDDQAGYYELLYHGSTCLSLDYRQDFCANFPAESHPLALGENWLLDQPKFRITHRRLASSPYAVHFPGQNKDIYATISNLSEATQAYSDPEPSTDYPWVVSMIVLIVVIVLLLALVWLAWKA